MTTLDVVLGALSMIGNVAGDIISIFGVIGISWFWKENKTLKKENLRISSILNEKNLWADETIGSANGDVFPIYKRTNTTLNRYACKTCHTRTQRFYDLIYKQVGDGFYMGLSCPNCKSEIPTSFLEDRIPFF